MAAGAVNMHVNETRNSSAIGGLYFGGPARPFHDRTPPDPFGVALHVTLYGHVMSGMWSDLVLRINRINFLICVVYEHILGAMFLDALGCAFASLGVCPLGSALTIGNPAGQTAVCRRGHGCCE